jgi:hypothetical protein
MSDRLATYPYVIVRFDCTLCHRKGQYSLARLADKYGADITMRELLGFIAGDCKYWRPRYPGHLGCGARFTDLVGPGPPPDLPPGMMRLRLIK